MWGVSEGGASTSLHHQAGDHGAFADLVVRHGALVQRLCALYVGRRDAADAAQEIWLTVLLKLRGLEDDAAFVPWLRTLAFYKCIDFRRRRGRQQRGEVRLNPEEWLRLAQCVADDAGALDDALERRELRRCVLAEVERLPDHLCVLLRIRLLGECSYRDIAATVQLPLSTVKWRLHEARMLLRMRLAGIIGENRRTDR